VETVRHPPSSETCCLTRLCCHHRLAEGPRELQERQALREPLELREQQQLERQGQQGLVGLQPLEVDAGAGAGDASSPERRYDKLKNCPQVGGSRTKGKKPKCAQFSVSHWASFLFGFLAFASSGPFRADSGLIHILVTIFARCTR
jgi:hypothetical protein